jgi:hypothetical protein
VPQVRIGDKSATWLSVISIIRQLAAGLEPAAHSVPDDLDSHFGAMKASALLMGRSLAGHLSREPRPTSATAATPKQRGILDTEREGLLSLHRTMGNQAVGRLLRSSRAPTTGPLPVAARQPLLPATLSRPMGNQALLRLMGGAATPPQVVAPSHPDESAAQELATAAMSMGDPGRQRVSRPGVPGGLDPDTRAFFEPRFGVDLGDVRVHAGPVAAQSAARLGASAYALGTDIVMGAGQQVGRNLITAHELAHLVRGDTTGRVCRAPGGSEGFVIISKVWRVGGRDIVLVATGSGNQVLLFYRRTGLGNKGVGGAPEAGKWPRSKPWLRTRFQAIS